ncbi:WecB/TagA/CpsF family glycosyltransferase [Seohaeicola zhoushanensis]|uniref:Teichoic acid biosynthesis glycosyltransferase n=1 Tax=Seohaeicola zhoushanensis TaxID=1569283 RepID=A0A8J3H2K5_9RHOB|nr:WecB/TagA/CpsF family glycosyltransferase [Seohaeicola zhoushanensis]GHF71735.1 teichoic acid biosynthesis glycosyltransferase [Seohaeicola zhoushanensis]
MMNWNQEVPLPETGRSIAVNVATREALLADLGERLQQRRGFCLATLNLDHVVKFGRLPAFAEAYRQHSHVTADGNPVVWLSRLAGQQVDLLPGSDLVVPVAALAGKAEVPAVLFGSTEEALEGAARVLETRAPGFRVAACIAPSMNFDPVGAEADRHVEALRASGAGLCFVALGAPKQELFAAYASRQLPHMGFLSIGAGLDFLSGRQRRAPRLFRLFAAEWLWRLALDPRRMARRYAPCIAILPRLAGRALRTRFGDS